MSIHIWKSTRAHGFGPRDATTVCEMNEHAEGVALSMVHPAVHERKPGEVNCGKCLRIHKKQLREKALCNTF